MRKQIDYLRLHYPALYSQLIQFSMVFRRKNKTITIFSGYGGDFKLYMYNHEMEPKVAQLKAGLDEYSIRTVDVVVTRLLNYPNRDFNVTIKNDFSNVIGGLLEEETKENNKLVTQALKRILREVKFSSYNMDASVFYYDHGLKYLPDQVKEYIRDSDFLDLGAYSGDSAIALNKYNYRKIYSVEMSEKAIQNFKVNLKRNNIESSKYQIIRAAVTDTDKNEPIYFSDNTYSIYSDKLTDEKNAKYEVPQRSVDSLVSEYKFQPKFIKADIEGFGLECVKGAVQTLKKNRPVLSLAIYHNPYEFFETKPFLESILNNYTFMIRKMAITPFGLRCHAETFLLAYPNEIIPGN